MKVFYASILLAAILTGPAFASYPCKSGSAWCIDGVGNKLVDSNNVLIPPITYPCYYTLSPFNLYCRYYDDERNPFKICDKVATDHGSKQKADGIEELVKCSRPVISE